MKTAPVIHALSECQGVRQTLVHTGQHYDENMSQIFFRELELPNPDINLEVGSNTHAVQTAQIMIRFEEVVLAQRPELVLVYGDINSTLAAALVCAKLHVPVGHVEAGLRSFDRAMPEEINRLLTDQIAELLFTPSFDADKNLLREGIAPNKIHRVGNVMIDTLVRLLPLALARWDSLRAEFNLEQYGLVTLHRPSNVDDPVVLASIMKTLGELSRDVPLIFSVHPRTRQRLEHLWAMIGDSQLRLVDPLGYLDFLALQRHAIAVITDSGGIQEETTFLGVPCLTLRENTERPITVTMGTNTLVGQDMDRLRSRLEEILAGRGNNGQVPPLWDGHAAGRIVSGIKAWACLSL